MLYILDNRIVFVRSNSFQLLAYLRKHSLKTMLQNRNQKAQGLPSACRSLAYSVSPLQSFWQCRLLDLGWLLEIQFGKRFHDAGVNLECVEVHK
jgi:hypothetical protein